ncbi:hypothetical protein JCM10212_000186 [Sporobolomyces blumeae]
MAPKTTQPRRMLDKTDAARFAYSKQKLESVDREPPVGSVQLQAVGGGQDREAEKTREKLRRSGARKSPPAPAARDSEQKPETACERTVPGNGSPAGQVHIDSLRALRVHLEARPFGASKTTKPGLPVSQQTKDSSDDVSIRPHGIRRETQFFKMPERRQSISKMLDMGFQPATISTEPPTLESSLLFAGTSMTNSDRGTDVAGPTGTSKRKLSIDTSDSGKNINPPENDSGPSDPPARRGYLVTSRAASAKKRCARRPPPLVRPSSHLPSPSLSPPPQSPFGRHLSPRDLSPVVDDVEVCRTPFSSSPSTSMLPSPAMSDCPTLPSPTKETPPQPPPSPASRPPGQPPPLDPMTEAQLPSPPRSRTTSTSQDDTALPSDWNCFRLPGL